MSIDAFLNNFAIRSFRNVADFDYMTARMAYRGRLIPQFHWSALQAIEKYLKCILLLNRVKATRIQHDLGKALELVEGSLFTLRLTKESRDFIKHLDRFGQFRYLEISYYVRGFEVLALDRAVWELRRYCQPLNAKVTGPDGKEKTLKALLLNSIERAESKPYQKYKLFGGEIERVLDDREHPAREALVWRNLFFGRSHRKSVRMQRYSHSANSPLALHPHMLDEVLKYAFVPKRVADAFRVEAKSRARGGSTR